jgi:hypothetical protein
MGGLDPAASSASATDGALSRHSPVAAKIALFRSLFRGREDVYRRDRRKDQLLQENGYFVLRFLAEDVGKELDTVLDAILRVLSRRRA